MRDVFLAWERPCDKFNHVCVWSQCCCVSRPPLCSQSDAVGSVVGKAQQWVWRLVTVAGQLHVCGCQRIPANDQIQAVSGLRNERHSQTTVQVPRSHSVHLQKAQPLLEASVSAVYSQTWDLLKHGDCSYHVPSDPDRKCFYFRSQSFIALFLYLLCSLALLLGFR